MSIQMIQGKKGRHDRIIFYNGSPIRYFEFGELFSLLCRNEDLIHPKPRFRGSDFLMEFLIDIKKAGTVTPEIVQKYKL